MKTFIAAVAIVWGVILTAEPALAQCQTQTIFLPDGRIMTCTTCCHAYGCGPTNCM